MTTRADAWFVPAGDGSPNPPRAELVRGTLELSDPGPGEVLVAPLYGCWEGNMEHALARRPIDVCLQRNEPRVVIGNAGVVRVLAVGPGVDTVEPGQAAIIFCNGKADPFGYPDLILAYDDPGSQGCLATRMKLRGEQLIALPEFTRHSLPQWAAFSLRYVTAWSNWELAFGTLRLLVEADEMEHPHVWGWGGGVTFAELDLARLHGCKTVMLSGNDERLAAIEAAGIEALDRRRFGGLDFDAERYRADAGYRARYKEAEGAFADVVRRRTDGTMVQIFVDMIGEPVVRATLRALGSPGVITTAGWKHGMRIRMLRAKECIARHQHVHTHYARRSQGLRAVEFAEARGWMPPVHDERIWSFDEIPDLAEAYREGRTGMFPLFAVNPG